MTPDIIVTNCGGDRFVKVVQIGYRSTEDIPILQYLVDGFDHAVREYDIDLSDELPDRRTFEVRGNYLVIVSRSAIDDEIDAFRRGG